MNWYKGVIAEAAETCITTKACLLVFIEGNCKDTKRLEGYLNDSKLQHILKLPKFVSIRFASDSTTYRLFVSIYRIVPVPSIFFIGHDGLPVEIGTSYLKSGDELKEKAQRVQHVLFEKTNISVTTAASAGETTTDVATTSSADTTSVATAPAAAILAPVLPVRVSLAAKAYATQAIVSTTPADISENSAAATNIVCDGKECVKQSNSKKATEKVAAVIKQANMPLITEEIEMKERSQRRAQIAADRLEWAQRRVMKGAVEKGTSNEISKFGVPTKGTEEKNNFTRVQFRLPDGKSHTSTFQCCDKLGVLREYVKTALLGNTSEQFMLTTSYPKLELKVDFDVNNLVELGLGANSVILVIMQETGNNKLWPEPFGGLFGFLNAMLIFLTSPIFGLASYLGRFFRAPSFQNTGEIPKSTGSTDKNMSDSNKNNARQNRQNSSDNGTNNTDNTSVKRLWTGSSNMHRLSDRRPDDEDENATWNGNSTQQQ